MKLFLDQVRAEAANILLIDKGGIMDDSALVNDLDADSLDVIDLTYTLAQKFKINMPTTSLYQHAVDNLTEQELALLFEDDALTPLGKKLFSVSGFKYTEKQLSGIETLADIYSETSVFNWASLCKAVSETESKDGDQLLIKNIKDFPLK